MTEATVSTLQGERFWEVDDPMKAHPEIHFDYEAMVRLALSVCGHRRPKQLAECFAQWFYRCEEYAWVETNERLAVATRIRGRYTHHFSRWMLKTFGGRMDNPTGGG